MSRKQEKQEPLALFKQKLRQLGLHGELAAKNMLRDLERNNVPGAVVESVDQLLTFALHKQREKFKEQLQMLIKDL